MLQRKQSVFLLVSFLLTMSLFFIGLGEFAGPNGIYELTFYNLRDVTNPDKVVDVDGMYFIPVAALIVLTTLLNFMSIFMFMRRPLQMKVCGINVGIELGLSLLILYLQYTISSGLEYEWSFHYSVVMPILAAVLGYFAYRAISDDEALIRSLNRLR